MTHLTELRRSAKRRTAVGSLLLTAGLATLSMANSPLAFGQQIGIGNNGGATAGTGGNDAVGNTSTNTQTSDTTATGGGLLGLDDLIGVDVGLGAPTNTSSGTGTVNSGPATASGNESSTGADQYSSGGGSGGFNPANPFAPAAPQQSLNVNNTGQGVASTGGNTAVGNNSSNQIGSTGSAGLIDLGVGLAGPTNTSTGNATVNSGAANATGNQAGTNVNQARVGDANGGSGLGAGGFGAPGFGPGFVPGTVTGFGSAFDPCSNRFFPFSPFFGGPGGANTTVTNAGTAGASTGNNDAIGNNSVNEVTNSQTVSGGLIGLGVNLGAPSNNSSGTATIGTGTANASGNQSTNTVNQVNAPCGLGAGAGPGHTPRNVITGAPIVVPVITPATVHATDTLARTGFGTAALLLLAAAMMFGGSMLLGSSRRRRQMATATAGTAQGISSAEWEAAARWHRGGPRLL